MFRSGSLVIILLAILAAPLHVDSAFLYKSYTIRYDRGWDILCDPYIVQKNDWVLKLFKQRGEIAHKDFPEFLRLFKRINTHIRDIDRIRPGQHIMIPLRKLKQGTLPGQSSGIVTIPFVTISNTPRALKTHSAPYEVKKGYCISALISGRFGTFGSETYREGIKLFKLVNPDINDLDRIYAGQMIHIPDPSILNQPWYPSLFGHRAESSGDVGFDPKFQPETQTSQPLISVTNPKQTRSFLEMAASILNARLLNKGKFYFPRQGQDDFELDLSELPILELEDGARIVFPGVNNRWENEIKIITSNWNNVKVVRVAPDAPTEQAIDAIFESMGVKPLAEHLSFSDQGVKVEARGKWIITEPSATQQTFRKVCISLVEKPDQRTPESICRYLEQHDIIIKEVLTGKDAEPASTQRPQYPVEDVITIDPLSPRSFVNDLLTAMGFQFAPNVSITFPYAGIQVKAISNLVVRPARSPLLIDFGDFYGDAVSAIEKSGFDIIQIKSDDMLNTMTQKLLNALGLSYSNNPTFWAANRTVDYNTNLTIPGFLITDEGKPKVLLSGVPLHNGIIQMLKHQGVKIIMLGMQERYS
ncbi:MAG: hypothetical protein KKH68_12155 [Proteobacteria bacterium]|nr:hypothetical protein [Pseudomonadota bacterium]